MSTLLQPHVPDHRYTSVLGKFYPQQAQNFEAERKPAEVRIRGATGRELVKLGFSVRHRLIHHRACLAPDDVE